MLFFHDSKNSNSFPYVSGISLSKNNPNKETESKQIEGTSNFDMDKEAVFLKISMNITALALIKLGKLVVAKARKFVPTVSAHVVITTTQFVAATPSRNSKIK